MTLPETDIWPGDEELMEEKCNHEWQRRRDGRSCKLCGFIEFGNSHVPKELSLKEKFEAELLHHFKLIFNDDDVICKAMVAGQGARAMRNLMLEEIHKILKDFQDEPNSNYVNAYVEGMKRVRDHLTQWSKNF